MVRPLSRALAAKVCCSPRILINFGPVGHREHEVILTLIRSVGVGGLATVTLALTQSPGLAGSATVIDLTYDSVMDMVRPEVYPGIAVHHTLQMTLSDRNKVAESRERSTRNASDTNSMRQVLGGANDAGTYAVWHVVSKDTLERIQHDPQSTRTMTVTLASPTTCRLDIRDELKLGFNEYAFLRIRTHTMGYFSSYHVTNTSCSIH
jgi:hypothetical protein